MGGGEDFAFVSVEAPTIGVFLGAGDSAQGYAYPQHHPKAVFDDSVLCRGAAAYAYSALRWRQEHHGEKRRICSYLFHKSAKKP